MALVVKYDGSIVAEVNESSSITLKTADKRCVSDIEIEAELASPGHSITIERDPLGHVSVVEGLENVAPGTILSVVVTGPLNGGSISAYYGDWNQSLDIGILLTTEPVTLFTVMPDGNLTLACSFKGE